MRVGEADPLVEHRRRVHELEAHMPPLPAVFVMRLGAISTVLAATASLAAGAALPDPVEPHNFSLVRRYEAAVNMCDGFYMSGECWTHAIPEPSMWGICINILQAAKWRVSSFTVVKSGAWCTLYTEEGCWGPALQANSWDNWGQYNILGAPFDNTILSMQCWT